MTGARPSGPWGTLVQEGRVTQSDREDADRGIRDEMLGCAHVPPIENDVGNSGSAYLSRRFCAVTRAQVAASASISIRNCGSTRLFTCTRELAGGLLCEMYSSRTCRKVSRSVRSVR